MGRATLAAIAFLVTFAVARADEASARSALDAARAQLDKQQWDRCRDALDKAAADIARLDGKARATAQREHDLLLAKCSTGERAYPHKAAVAQAKSALETARQDLALENAQGAASDLDDARRAIAGVDAPTKERFEKEIAELAGAVAAGQQDARFKRIDQLLEGQETELAKKFPSVEALQVGAGLIDGELDKADPLDARSAPRHERARAQRARIATLAGSGRGRVLVPVLRLASTVQGSKEATETAAVRPPTKEEWTLKPSLSAHAGACESVIDAVDAWLSSAALETARRQFPGDAELSAALAAMRKLGDDARHRLCEVADAILALLGAAPDGNTLPSVREIQASLEKRAGPRGDAVVARARALATKLGAPAATAPSGDGKDKVSALRAGAAALWPGMLAAHGATADMGSTAIPSDGSWNGRLVRLTGISNRLSDPFVRRVGPHLVASVNGGLVAGVLDEGLWDALYKARMQTAIEPDAIHDLVAEVRGSCRIDRSTYELVLDPSRAAVEAPLLRIVAVEVGVYALSLKRGTNVAGIDATERGITGIERRLAARPGSSWEKWLSLGLAGVAVLVILWAIISTVRLFRTRRRDATMVLRRSQVPAPAPVAPPASVAPPPPVEPPPVSAPAPAVAPAGRAHVTVTRIQGVVVRKTFCATCGGDQVVSDKGHCILCGAAIAEADAEAAASGLDFTPIRRGGTGPSTMLEGSLSPLFLRFVLIFLGIGLLAATGGRFGHGRYGRYGGYRWSRPAPRSYYNPYPQPAITPHGPGFDMPEYGAGGGGDDDGD